MHIGAYYTHERRRIPAFNSNGSPIKVKESTRMCVFVRERSLTGDKLWCEDGCQLYSSEKSKNITHTHVPSQATKLGNTERAGIP